MGLDTSHDCWHGSYSSFMEWRHRLASLVGIPLRLMEGFFDDDERALLSMSKLHFASQISEALPIRWELLKPDPLYKLLHHSDCEGELLREDCSPLANRLEELLPKFEGEDAEIYRNKTRQFIDGLRRADAAGENVEFH